MPNSECDVLVAGAGVSGLTTGICLAEQGLRVTIWAKDPPQQTTSSVAGAVWGPHMVEAGERTARRAMRTLAVLRGLAAEGRAGVRIGHGVEAYRQAPAAAPEENPPTFAKPGWFGQVIGMRACEPAELPAGFAGGWRYSAPLVHMPSYLGYLLERFRRAGGRTEAAAVTSLAGAARAAGARAVVNCTGSGAHDLVPDPALVPVRGQIVVAANPGIGEFFIGLPGGQHELVYIFPHGDTVILGGTEQVGNPDTEPDPADAQRILRDCVAAEPRLAGARVLAHRVGLRPVRPTVRLEAERPGGGTGRDAPLVVHNYGHGGAGVTVSWGCAQEAARLIIQETGLSGRLPPAATAGSCEPSAGRTRRARPPGPGPAAPRRRRPRPGRVLGQAARRPAASAPPRPA